MPKEKLVIKSVAKGLECHYSTSTPQEMLWFWLFAEFMKEQFVEGRQSAMPHDIAMSFFVKRCVRLWRCWILILRYAGWQCSSRKSLSSQVAYKVDDFEYIFWSPCWRKRREVLLVGAAKPDRVQRCAKGLLELYLGAFGSAKMRHRAFLQNIKIITSSFQWV